MRIMGVDYGDARTGIAMSDLLCSIVGSTTVIHSRRDEKTVAEIKKLIEQNGVTEIVVGLPRNMNGTEGPRAEACKAFAKLLKEATGLPVAMWMSAGPRWKLTTFSPPTTTTARSGKIPLMQ